MEIQEQLLVMEIQEQLRKNEKKGLDSLTPFDSEIEATARRRRSRRKGYQNTSKMIERIKSLLEYGIPDTATGLLSSIVRPPITAQSFELKPQFIQFISNDSFASTPHECPVSHIDSFLDKCDTIKLNGVTDDAIRLRLFPFSLRDIAKEWLRDEGIGSFDTWDKLAKAFLVRFLGQEKTARLRNELATFRQSDDESLYEAWRRFKSLQRQCPHHGIPEWMLIQTFYNGLTHEFLIYIDAASGGSLMTKNPTEAKELIEKMAANDNYHPGGRHSVKKGGKLDVDALTLLTSSGHIAPNCPKNSSEMSIEEANAFYTSNPKRPYDTHSNTYNEGWRNHSDFSYMNTQAQLNSPSPPPSFQARASFNHQPMNQKLPPQTSKYNIDSIMETFTTSQLRQQELMTKQFELQAKQNEHFESSIQMLIVQNKRIETHLSQLSQ
ncbi:uncharacterized protein LOC110697917 [Chenopodium quinoa]|uniref:uncharacterized protein LOC110697917 n=1 Tax=Chenopodium quinoa TaxID=63459 RepID=UPI000B76ED38|nr:uncharacterized protein LOC110697917 [Chenopodium quinoa]